MKNKEIKVPKRKKKNVFIFVNPIIYIDNHFGYEFAKVIRQMFML